MSASHALALEGGFKDAVRDSQAVFRVLMAAFAEPAMPRALNPRVAPPAPISRGLGAVVAALADPDTPLHLDAALAAAPAVRAWIAFHTGAPVVADPAEAAFALVSDARRLPALSAFAPGTLEYPDRSTTVVVAVEGFSADGPLFFGPGFEAPRRFRTLPERPGLAAEWSSNRALFPRGVDLLFVTDDAVAALPRSARLLSGE